MVVVGCGMCPIRFDYSSHDHISKPQSFRFDCMGHENMRKVFLKQITNAPKWIFLIYRQGLQGIRKSGNQYSIIPAPLQMPDAVLSRKVIHSIWTDRLTSRVRPSYIHYTSTPPLGSTTGLRRQRRTRRKALLSAATSCGFRKARF